MCFILPSWLLADHWWLKAWFPHDKYLVQLCKNTWQMAENHVTWSDGDQVLLGRCGQLVEGRNYAFLSRSPGSLSARTCPHICASRTEELLFPVAGLLLQVGWLFLNRLDLGRTMTSRYNKGSSSHDFLKPKTCFLVVYSIRVKSFFSSLDLRNVYVSGPRDNLYMPKIAA